MNLQHSTKNNPKFIASPSNTLRDKMASYANIGRHRLAELSARHRHAAYQRHTGVTVVLATSSTAAEGAACRPS